jgi:putative SOS response-associated peptidase YedK
MCGRFTLSVSGAEVAEWFGLSGPPAVEPRYNIAPTQPVAIIRAAPDGPARHLSLARWGLVPSWAQDLAFGNRMINARAETVADKPAFRSAFRRRRCLIPASGFYEWRAQDGGKQPYLIGLAGGRPFALAGLWETWGPGGEAVESCAILTTQANALMRPIHERMPVILAPADYGLWLDGKVQDPARLQPLLRPYADGEMVAHAVSTWVNNPRHDDPRCLEPAA